MPDLHHPRYPRTNGYDPDWVVANQMGPNALWLLESVLEVLPISAGDRVLDLGCGKAMTSIFLAREYGANVTAVDLWIDAEENRARLVEAGVDDLVTAVNAEAHDLPFDHGSFDAIVSIDAYHYFGTDDLYLGYLAPFLRLGGWLGVAVPATTTDLATSVPDHLAPFWEWEFHSFHSPDWWERHWTKTGLVTVERAELIEDGWRDWQRFTRLTAPTVEGWLAEAAASEVAMLDADQGRVLGLARLVARRPDEPSEPDEPA